MVIIEHADILQETLRKITFAFREHKVAFQVDLLSNPCCLNPEKTCLNQSLHGKCKGYARSPTIQYPRCAENLEDLTNEF